MDKLDIIQKEIQLLHEYCDALKTLSKIHKDKIIELSMVIKSHELRISELEDK